MHLVSCHADLDCSQLEHVCHHPRPLHNMLKAKSRNSYSPPEISEEEIDFQTVRPGSWRSDPSSMCLRVSKKADKTTIILKMLKKFKID